MIDEGYLEYYEKDIKFICDYRVEWSWFSNKEKEVLFFVDNFFFFFELFRK